MTFNFNNQFEEFVANAKYLFLKISALTFCCLNPALQIKITGDIEDPDEYFEIINEDGQIIGTTSNSNIYTTPGDCNNPSYTNLNININDFSLWAKDGCYHFTARPANTTDRINPCNPVNINGESDQI